MIEPVKQPVVMTIAGFDPSGGAGVLADVKTISAFECYGVAVLTSLTFQNTQQVFGLVHQTADSVGQQIDLLFDDFQIAAIKTGMLPTAEIIRTVADVIKARPVPLVVDPVWKSTSGFALVDEQATEALTKSLFPLASLVTPNLAEARQLTGFEVRTLDEMERAARVIMRLGSRAVLITGGDGVSDIANDVLIDAQGLEVFSTQRIYSKGTHGTGCTFASAVTCLLALGFSVRESIPIAKKYISQAILGAPHLGHGQGPVNHFPRGFKIRD
ncbi:MAG: bifunctional hydroxymethylpyrimidine kinase/phosphomethylpyrimidine kinase [Blastocatellia bacterium]